MSSNAGALAQRAAAHFNKLSHRQIEVPEWGEADDVPLIVYAKAVSAGDAAKLYRTGRESNFEMYIEALIMLACDAGGKNLFTIGDKPLLRRAAFEVVERVGAELCKSRTGAELMEPFETTVKNSEASPSA